MKAKKRDIRQFKTKQAQHIYQRSGDQVFITVTRQKGKDADEYMDKGELWFTPAMTRKYYNLLMNLPQDAEFIFYLHHRKVSRGWIIEWNVKAFKVKFNAGQKVIDEMDLQDGAIR